MSSKKLDAAIDGLLMRWPSCRSTSLRVGSAATGSGCASYASLAGAIPASCRRRDRFAASRPEPLSRLRLACAGALVRLASASRPIAVASLARATARRLRGPSQTTGTKKGCQFAYAGCLQSPTCPAARSMSLWANACGQHGRSPSRSGNPRRQPRSHRTGDVIDQTSASSRDRRKSGRCCRHPSEITRSG